MHVDSHNKIYWHTVAIGITVQLLAIVVRSSKWNILQLAKGYIRMLTGIILVKLTV